MGPNAKELFRLVEDFVDVIGFRMKDLRDAYQVTDNLGKPSPRCTDFQAPAPQSWAGRFGLSLLVYKQAAPDASCRTPGPGSKMTSVSSGAQTRVF